MSKAKPKGASPGRSAEIRSIAGQLRRLASDRRLSGYVSDDPGQPAVVIIRALRPWMIREFRYLLEQGARLLVAALEYGAFADAEYALFRASLDTKPISDGHVTYEGVFRRCIDWLADHADVLPVTPTPALRRNALPDASGQWYTINPPKDIVDPEYVRTNLQALASLVEAEADRSPAADTVSAPKAAEILGLDVGHIRKLCREGKLEAERDDRDEWHIERASIDAYKGHARRPTPKVKPSLTPPTQLPGNRPQIKTWYCGYCDGEDVQSPTPPTRQCPKCGKSRWIRRSLPTRQQ